MVRVGVIPPNFLVVPPWIKINGVTLTGACIRLEIYSESLGKSEIGAIDDGTF